MPDAQANPLASGRTSLLLACGAAIAPIFFVVVFAQAWLRPGFDIGRAPLSLLSLGDLGWIQIADFIGTGLLGLACAVGLRGAIGGGRGGLWGPLAVTTFGIGLILAGLFHPDPGYGFPPRSGAPQGMLPSMSSHMAVHSAGFVVVVVSLVVASLVLARIFHARGERGWSRYSLGTGVAGPVLLASGIATGTVPLITLMAVVLFAWLSATSAHLRTGLVRS